MFDRIWGNHQTTWVLASACWFGVKRLACWYVQQLGMRVDLEIGLLVHEDCNSNREKIEKVMHCITMLVCFSFCILGLFFGQCSQSQPGRWPKTTGSSIGHDLISIIGLGWSKTSKRSDDFGNYMTIRTDFLMIIAIVSYLFPSDVFQE